MPGFNINGAGGTGSAPLAKSELRRKHRWRFTAGFLKAGEWAYLLSAKRPKLSFEPAVMHHDQEEAYFAGKQKWDPIEVVFYDAQQPLNISGRIYDWLVGSSQSVLGSMDRGAGLTVNAPNQYKIGITLQMTDGRGAPNETWELLNAWPKDYDWQEISYENNEIARVQITLQFDRAIRVGGSGGNGVTV